jgi:large subunit ribosomal protein L25
MSAVKIVINAEARADVGKGASRRLRHAGKVPAVLYGGNKQPESVLLSHNEMFLKADDEAFYSHILTINVKGAMQKAVVKDVQWHPYKPVIMHMDFQRVDESTIIRIHVPVHFIGEDTAPGVKAGGIVSHQMTNVEVSCQAGKLPEYLVADISKLEVGDAVHLADLQLPAGVEIPELAHGPEHNLSVASIMMPRAAVADEETAAPEAAAEGEEEGKAE